MAIGILLAAALVSAEPAAQTADSLQQDMPASPVEAAPDENELARQLSNPVANLISVPFQQNVDFSVGPEEGVRSTLNIQPVIPVSIASNWNVIIRTIVPIIYQDDVVPDSSQFGLSDTVQSFFFSPKTVGASGIVWGAGPVFLYPTATDRFLGTDKWGAGPTGVLLRQSGPHTIGFLANHIWSIAGDNGRADVSTTFLQPFYTYTTPSALTISINTESTYNWESEKWTVPINLSATQLTRMGKQPISVGGGVRYYVSAPQHGPNWGFRLIFNLLFPKRRGQ